MTESFIKYRYIQQSTGRVLYEYLLNEHVITDIDTKLREKQVQLSDSKDIPFEDIFFERY